MRNYNIFLCPKCKSFEFRPIPIKKWICKAGSRKEELDVDSNRNTSLIDPPPTCEDFILKERK